MWKMSFAELCGVEVATLFGIPAADVGTGGSCSFRVRRFASGIRPSAHRRRVKITDSTPLWRTARSENKSERRGYSQGGPMAIPHLQLSFHTGGCLVCNRANTRSDPQGRNVAAVAFLYDRDGRLRHLQLSIRRVTRDLPLPGMRPFSEQI